ncbi:MAG: hypothetical protein AAGG81_08415, partial [Chlamydiota bacterium]
GISVAGSLVGFTFNAIKTFHTHEEWNILQKNIEILEKEHSNCKDLSQAMLLHAKLDHLKVLSNSLANDLTKSVLQNTSDLLSVVAATKVCLATAGVILPAGAVTILSATGVGAVALGTGLTVTKVAHTAYKNRFEILYHATTVDIKPRLLLNKIGLKRLLNAYLKINTREMEFQRAKILLEGAYHVKEQLDQQKGDEEIKKQAMASSQLLKHTLAFQKAADNLNEALEEFTPEQIERSNKIQSRKETVKELGQRKKIAERKLSAAKLLGDFSGYDLSSLRTLQLYFNNVLANGGSDVDELCSFLKTHNYNPPKDDLTFDDLLEFITESETIVHESLAA